eukprot:gene10876-11030_t
MPAGPDAGPPPPAPIKGELLALGESFNTDEPFYPPLEMKKLYSVQADGSVDIKQELLKLNKGVLFLFLELLEVLVNQPTAYAALISELNIALNNMAHLLNMARPLQAQQTLKYALQSQVQEKQAALTALRATTSQMRQRVLELTSQLAAVGGDAAESAARPAASAAAKAEAADNIQAGQGPAAMEEG